MLKTTRFALPLLLLSSAPALGATTVQQPNAYRNVIVLGETPRKPLPAPAQTTSCKNDSATATYHRPAQSGIVNQCTVPTTDAAGSRSVPISVRSAP